MRLARKKYSCDFETTTDSKDCRVWAYGYMEIGNKNNYKIGNSIEEFMEWVKQCQSDLFFHNLRFDGEFIVNWLLKKGFKWEDSGLPNTFNTVISNMGQWYIVDICYGYKGKKKIHTIIYDSFKKLPFSVKQIGKDFNLEVLKIDKEQEFYNRKRPVGHILTDEEYAYAKNDIEVIASALEIQFAQGLDRITNGSDSMKGFKTSISTKMFDKLFPVLSLELDKNLRLAYRGGFTWLNDIFANKEITEGIVFDVVSLYPSQMYFRPLPHGMPIFFSGKYEEDEAYPLYIQHIKCEFELKEGRIPMIQIKKNLSFKQNEYLKSSGGEVVDLYLTNVDLELVKEHYDLCDVEYVGGWKFRQKIGMFKEFIDKWTYIKANSTGAIRLLAKLILNSLYGKFASNPDVTGKVPYLKDDGSCGFKVGDEEFKDPIYTPMGIFITSWARYTTISTAQKCYDRIIYCDTDSMHLIGTEIPEAIKDLIHDKKLGFWANESTFKRGKYIRQKTYVQDIYKKEIEKDSKKMLVNCSQGEATSTVLSVKCAGMPDAVKEKVTFDNFNIGFSSYGKLLPKHVNGGVVLVDTEFTIK